MSSHRIVAATSQIRTSTVRAFSLGIITGAFITAGVLAAVPAKADGFLDDSENDYVNAYHSAICQTIDEYHSFSGVLGVAAAIVEDGFAEDSAVDMINAAVWGFCPRNWPLLVSLGRSAQGTAA